MTRPLLVLSSLALLAAMIAIPGAARAQPEDAEHRADRLRTIELNRRAQAAYSGCHPARQFPIPD